MARSLRDPSLRKLDDALEAIVELRAALQPFDPLDERVPSDALERALLHHIAYRRAQAATAEAMHRLRSQIDAPARADLLSVENLLREEAAIIADVAYALALMPSGARGRGHASGEAPA